MEVFRRRDDDTVGWHCGSCGASYQRREQLVPIQARQTVVLACPRCRRRVDELRARVVEPFGRQLAAAALFPWRGDGKLTFLPLAVLSWFFLHLGVHNAFPAMDVLGVLVGLALPLGYWSVVVVASARGAQEAPGPKEIAGLGDLFSPFFRFVFALASCLAPGLALLAWGERQAAIVVLTLGVLLLPAQLLVAAYSWPLNPLTALRIITRIPAAYGKLLLALVLALGGTAGLLLLLGLVVVPLALIRMPILPVLIPTAALIYALLVVGRMLGVLVAAHEHELAIVD